MADDKDHSDEMLAPGVLVLSFIFLITFIVIWFLHLKWILELWGVE